MESEGLKPCLLWVKNNQTNDPSSGSKILKNRLTGWDLFKTFGFWFLERRVCHIIDIYTMVIEYAH